MINIKKIVIFYLLAITFISCFVRKTSMNKYTNKDVIQNLKYVTNFPDDYFFPKGDSICERILNRGKSITSLLIEKIDDTSNTNYIYADAIRYKVGDIAINLIDNLYNNSELPLRELLTDNFFDKNTDDYQYIMLYDFVFFNNSKKENFKNRKRFKKIMKEWFDKKKITLPNKGNRCTTHQKHK